MSRNIKYSKNFERDYNWYLENKDIFSFTGGKINKKDSIQYDPNGVTAKEAFYVKESTGKDLLCKEIDLLEELLDCKSGINFMIKQWSEGREDGTLPLVELSKDELYRKYPDIYKTKESREQIEELTTLEWINNESVYYRDLKTQYNLLDWMIDSIENQTNKLRRENISKIITK